MKLFRLFVFSASLLVPAAAFAGTICPAFPGDPVTTNTSHPTGCNTVITINSNGTLSFSYPDASDPYDGNDDNLVGVINNYGSAITSLTLNGGSHNIFGFDNDGIDTFTHQGNAQDNTGYGGQFAFFTGINGAKTTGTVNFLGGIDSGATSYFSLEDAPQGSDSITGTVSGAVPEPGSLALLGTGVLGLAGGWRRRFSK